MIEPGVYMTHSRAFLLVSKHTNRAFLKKGRRISISDKRLLNVPYLKVHCKKTNIIFI